MTMTFTDSGELSTFILHRDTGATDPERPFKSQCSCGRWFTALDWHLHGCWTGSEYQCVCSIESGPCERVDVFHVSGRFWSTSACGEKRTPARPAWTSFPS